MANNILELIEKEYKFIRERNDSVVAAALMKARQNEDYKELENKIKTLNFEIAKTEHFLFDAEKANELRKTREDLISEKNEILKRLNLTPSDLEKRYTCKMCRDTGFINGKPCYCFNEKWKKYIS